MVGVGMGTKYFTVSSSSGNALKLYPRSDVAR